jgi:glycerol-3-phosphate responsive antiterminator
MYVNEINGKEKCNMLPVLHPLAKTSIEARRAITRLENFMKMNPNDEYVVNGNVAEIIEDLKNIRRHIPKELLDVDLKED